jgi:HK97 family phage portal protein
MKLELGLGPFFIRIDRERKGSTRGSIEDPNTAITHQTVFGDVFRAGHVVSGEGAMAIGAALACVRVLAESVASLPWHAYERLTTGGKRRETDTWLYALLHNRSNPLMTAFTFRERVMKDVLLEGNHYSWIEYDEYGYIQALWPLNPRHTRIQTSPDGRAIRYVVRTSTGVSVSYHPEEIFHVPCLGDGILGKSVVSYNAGAFGLAMAEDEFAQSFFENGAHPGGVLETDKPLQKEARDRLRDGWSVAYGRAGLGSHKVAVLEDGLKWKPMTVNPKDAMALESRQYQVTEIARMFRVPPHMIADLSKATFSNIEHQSLDFVMHSLRPWCVRIEQEANWKFFGPDERDRYFTEFLMDGMLRGDVKSRNEAYAIQRQNGILNADEWRERENMNPLPDDQGKKYLVQLNMQELSKVGEQEDDQ